jgi:hypothetical protein
LSPTHRDPCAGAKFPFRGWIFAQGPFEKETIMTSTDDDLATARRHVHEAAWRLVRQAEMVEDLTRHHLAAEAEMARQSLAGMKQRLEQARAHLRVAQDQQP